MDTVPGFANEYLVDEYHEQVVQQIQKAANLEQILVGVYTVGNNMVAAGQATMIPTGTRIVQELLYSIRSHSQELVLREAAR